MIKSQPGDLRFNEDTPPDSSDVVVRHVAFQRSPRLLAIGDSHVHFWSGESTLSAALGIFPGLDRMYVGPVTAFNLPRHDAKAGARRKIDEFLAENKTNYGALLFCFGEIDCRVHLVRNALVNGTSLTEATWQTVERYTAYIKDLHERVGLPCLIWGPIASAPDVDGFYNPDFPAVGSTRERNYVTAEFNRLLADATSQVEGVEHVSIFEHLVDAAGLTRSDSLYDSCHLSAGVMDKAEDALRAGLARAGCLEEMAPALRRWRVSARPVTRNIASGLPYTVSSTIGGVHPTPFEDGPVGRVMFHTAEEPSPSLTFGFGSMRMIEAVRIHNRSDACQERARSITVEVSVDGEHYDVIYAPDAYVTPGTGADALLIRPAEPIFCRFIRLALRERTFFHLECVEILAASFDEELLPTHLPPPPPPAATPEASAEPDRACPAEPEESPDALEQRRSALQRLVEFVAAVLDRLRRN